MFHAAIVEHERRFMAYCRCQRSTLQILVGQKGGRPTSCYTLTIYHGFPITIVETFTSINPHFLPPLPSPHAENLRKLNMSSPTTTSTPHCFTSTKRSPALSPTMPTSIEDVHVTIVKRLNSITPSRLTFPVFPPSQAFRSLDSFSLPTPVDLPVLD